MIARGYLLSSLAVALSGCALVGTPTLPLLDGVRFNVVRDTLEHGEAVVVCYLVNGSTQTVYYLDDRGATYFQVFDGVAWTDLLDNNPSSSDFFDWQALAPMDGARHTFRSDLWLEGVASGAVVAASGRQIHPASPFRCIGRVAFKEGATFPHRPLESETVRIVSEPFHVAR